MSNDKKTPPWLLFNTKNGKNAVLAAIKYKIYDDSIDYDNLAAAYPDIDNFLRDDFPDLQNKFIEGLQDQQKTNKKNSPRSAAKKKDVKPTGKEKKDINQDTSEKKPEKIETRGRKRLNENTAHELRNQYLREKNADSFLLVQNNTPTHEILQNTELYTELLTETVKTIYDNYLVEYPDKVKKHPSIWFRHLCLLVKLNSPKIENIENYKMIEAAWNVYAALCLSIGINRTLENFQIFSGLNWKIIEKIRNGASPECIELSKKIYDACRSDIVGGLSSSFGSSPNQMFIAKSVYGLTENTVITHVSANEIKRNLDDIPVFNQDQIEKK